MFDSLKSSRSRTLFVVLTASFAIIVVAAAGALDYLANARPLPTVLLNAGLQLLYGTAAAAVGAGLVVIMYNLVRADEVRLDQIECVAPNETKRQHKQALELTDFWYHDGHIARWVRTAALETLTRGGGQGGTKDVVLLILDPLNHEMIRDYSNYRSRLDFRERGYETQEQTIQQVLATVVTFQLCFEHNSAVRPRLYFRSHLRNSRVDISSTRAFRTLVDPRVPAVVYSNPTNDSRSSFYHALKEEFQHQVKASREFTFLEDSGLRSERLGVPAVQSYLAATGLLAGRDEHFVKGVISRVRSSYNPHK